MVYHPYPTSVIVNRLKKLKGNALVVGHSDTILEIAKGLGIMPTITKINSTDFDIMLIINIKTGLFINTKTIVEKQYGVETN